MIKINFKAGAIINGKFSIKGLPSEYQLVTSRSERGRGFDIIVQKNNQEPILFLSNEKMKIMGQVFHGAKRNGMWQTDQTHTYTGDKTEVKTMVLPICRFFWNSANIVGYLNGRRMFLARNKRGNLINFSCSSKAKSILSTDEAPIVLAFFCAFILRYAYFD